MPPHPIEKRAILGGTFDPIHWGHLGIAYTALAQVGLTQIIWVSDRHKRDPQKHSCVDFDHRQEMVRLAIAPEPAFSLGPAPSATAPYAIDTWQTLQQLYPQSQWYWIIGADAFSTLPKWYRAVELAQACEWLVAPRCQPQAQPSRPPEIPLLINSSPLNIQEGQPEIEARCNPTRSKNLEEIERVKTVQICQQVAIAFAARDVNLRWQILESPTLAIGSTLLRRHWSDWPKIRTWVPKPVQIYIQTHHLY